MGARFEIVVTDSSQGKPRDDRTPRDDNSQRDDQRPAQHVAGTPPTPSSSQSSQPAVQQPVSSSSSAPTDRQPAPNVKRSDDDRAWEKVSGQLISYAETVASTIAGGPVVSQLSAMIGVARPLIGAFRGDRTSPNPPSRGNREDGTLPIAADKSSQALDHLAVSAERASRSIGDPRQPPSGRQPSQRPVEQPPLPPRPPVDVPSESRGEQPPVDAIERFHDFYGLNVPPRDAPVEGEMNDETLSVIRHLMGRDEDLPSGVSQDTVDAIERLLDSGVDFSPPRRDAPVNMPKSSGGPVAPIGDPMAPAFPKPPPGAGPATPALGSPPVAALPAPVLPAPVGAAGAVAADTGLGVAGGAGVAVGGGTAAAAAIPVAVIAAGAVAAAAAIALLARSAKQAHDVMGPLGVAVTGAVGAISPVAGMLVGPVLKQIQAFGDAVERQVNELAEYSGVLSIAQARSELREMRTDISASRRLAPELSKFEDTRSRLGEAINGNIVEFRLVVLRLLEPLLPFLNRAADFIDIATEIIRIWSENKAAIEDARRGDLAAVLGHFGEVGKALKRIGDALEGEDEDSIIDDPYINDLLSNLGGPGGATGAFGGGGIVPRRRGS